MKLAIIIDKIPNKLTKQTKIIIVYELISSGGVDGLKLLSRTANAKVNIP